MIASVLVFSDFDQFLRNPSFPRLPSAEAAAGDIAIFRENTGTETVASTTNSVTGVTWDTTIKSNSNMTLQGDTATIDLADGGKYFVMYNVFGEEGTSTAGDGNRRAIKSWLSLNDSPLAYGRAGGYIRDGDGDLDAYSAGAAIIDAISGDDLKVHLQRDDTNPSSGVNIKPSTNGVSLVKLKDSWDYIRLRNTATSSNISGNTAFTDVTWNTSDEVDTDSFGFTPTSGNITLKGDDGELFMVAVNVGLLRTTSNTRLNYEMILTLDGTEVPATRVTTYPRGDNNGNGILSGTLVYSGIITKTSASEQTLNVEVRRESSNSANTVISANKTAFSAMKIPNTAEVIMIGDTTEQVNSSSRTEFTWDTNYRVDTTAFSHSVDSGTSEIQIDKAGDYLFFSTVYATTTTDNRSPYRVDWRKTGSLINYGGHGAFNRANQSYSSGSSGGLILDGLTASDYIELTHIDETSNTTDTATFVPNKVAIQGIALNENFFGTDVLVAATGTQKTETDFPVNNVEMGGAFVIKEQTSSRNITSITLTESGTVDAQNGLDNVEIWYDLDTTTLDCSSESFDGNETQFDTAKPGFSGPDGVRSFSGSVAISTSQTLCAYVVYDVTASSTDGDTVNISVANPSSDVIGSDSASVGPLTSESPTGSTTLRNAELTQIHYHWRNDDGSESSATSVDGAEDTPAIGFANGTIRRLRVEVSAEGSTSSPSVQYRLEYAQKTGICSAMTGWTDVGTGGGGDWDVVTTGNYTDGDDTTNLALAAFGAVTDENVSFIADNNAMKNSSSQTGGIVATSTQFIELEYAIEPTIGAPQGNTYCFRLTDAGTPLRNYDVYPEGTISADVDVSTIGSQVASLSVGTTSAYIGGTFVIARPGTARTLTDITFTETGTIDATELTNPRIYFDLDTTVPYDCASESFSLSDGSVALSAFSGSNGTSTVSGSISISNTQTFCGYTVFDVGSGAANGETINIEIINPSTEVIVTSSSVGPSTALSPTGSTTIAGPVLTQTGYHWRADDDTEANASSATGNLENTAITDVARNSTQRVRIQISNEGSVTSAATQYQLEYGTKVSSVSSCDLVSTWQNVDVGVAFVMASTSQLVEGSDTTDVSTTTSGGVSNPIGKTLLTPNGGQKEDTSLTGNITLTSNQFVELEYAIQATNDSAYGATYCFRVTDNGNELAGTPVYYPELITREKQDFFIQRGSETISGTSVTLTAGVDYTTPSATSSAFVRITNTQLTGAGNNAGTNGQQADDVTAAISDQSDITSSFTIARPSSATSNTRVDWEIVEFVGLSGSDNEMIVRDVGEVDFLSAEFTDSGSPVSSVVDDSAVVVFITGQRNDSTGTGASTHYNDGLFTAAWNVTTSAPDFERGDADVSADLSYAIVEFTGANWDIQRVEHQYTNSGVTEIEPITAINSISHAFIHAQKRVGAGLQGIDEGGHQVWISSLGFVSFELRSGAGTSTGQYSVAWVIENTQSGTGEMTVYQSSGSVDGPTGIEPDTYSYMIGGVNDTVRTSNASIFPSSYTSGTGTTYPRLHAAFRIASTTHYEMWQSDTNNDISFRVEVVEWPVANIALRQNYYRFYVDNDAIDPTDPWPVGVADLGENTSITAVNDPVAEGEVVRIRMTAAVSNANLPELTKSFKLQYGKRDSTCSAITEPSWNDVGAPEGGEIWRGYNGTPVDGSTVGTTTIKSVPGVFGTYEEQNNSTVNPVAVDVGQNVEYDWVIQHNGALQRTDYCFRMLESDDTQLAGYNNYPTLRTTGYTPVSANWRWYDDATNTTPTVPLANENSAPIDIGNENEIKLRIGVHEIESASGSNIRFALQYSEYADFSDGGTFIAASTTCTANSIWCHADGAGDDATLIQEELLTDSDTCDTGTGSGCGHHNEGTTTPSTLTQPANSKMEFEFTLRQAGARVNRVYYFRLYDLANDDIVLASSSYPSLVTEGASMVFETAGISSSTVIDGETIDIDSTPTVISFGNLPIDTKLAAAHRLGIDSNGTEGYKVLVYSNNDLTSSGGSVINPITGTNAIPVSWGTGCDVSANGCFGYHTTDVTLEGGSSRFSAQDTFAQLSSTTPEEISFSTSPVPGETVDIVYKVQISDEQEAGQYETNIIYIAIPIF